MDKNEIENNEEEENNIEIKDNNEDNNEKNEEKKENKINKKIFDFKEFDDDNDDFTNEKEDYSDADADDDDDDPILDENVLRAFYKFYEYSKKKKKKDENKILNCLGIFVKSKVNKRIKLIENKKIFKNLIFIVKNILDGNINLHEEISPFHKKILRRSLKQTCSDDIKHLLCENIETFYMLEDAYDIIVNNGE